MSKQLRIWLFVLLSTLLTSTTLLAEGVITMTTSKAVEGTISLKIEANGNVTIDGIKEEPHLGYGYYTLTNQTITIRGDVTELNCGGNQLTSLDVSDCTALIKLDCRHNNLTSLDVSKNTALTKLESWGNQLTSLNVSGCTALKKLDCSGPKSSYPDNRVGALTSLDVSGCTSLTDFTCSRNQLTSLDLSSCTALTNLDCSYNQLTSLKVSGCSALAKLNCSVNQLTSLDLSSCSALAKLDCSVNQLTSLDLSACSQLNYVDCSANQIKGDAMTQLVASLSTYNSGNEGESGKFIVVSNLAPEGNVCSKADVATAHKKNWNSLKRVDWRELLPYEGEDDNLQVGRGVITIKTTKAIGEVIALSIKADGGVAIEGVKPFLQPDGHIAHYTLTDQTVVIHGDVTEFGSHIPVSSATHLQM